MDNLPDDVLKRVIEMAVDGAGCNRDNPLLPEACYDVKIVMVTTIVLISKRMREQALPTLWKTLV